MPTNLPTPGVSDVWGQQLNDAVDSRYNENTAALTTHETADLLHPFTGTGSPEGVVTAPPGSTFLNTESGGWNGARRWTKATGTGATGWVVSEGDTGWRDVTGLLVNGWTATAVIVRRTGSWIEVRVVGLADNSSASTEFITSLPVGMRFDAPRATYIAEAIMTGTAGSSSGLINCAGGSGERLRATKPQTNGNGSISGSTIGAWPTTLPGTAA